MGASAQVRRRAGSGVRARIRTEILAAVRASWRNLVIFIIGYVVIGTAVVVGIRLFGGGDLAVGFFVGLLVGLLGFFAKDLLVAHGIAHRSMGGDAETWTAIELRQLDRRRWTVMHHVPLPSRGDVDHVAIGPGRVYAIETKWSARSDVDRFLAGAATQAERQAQALRAKLRVSGMETDVIPLLVVWGPRMAASVGEKPRMLGDARVVAGAHATTWLEKMEAAAVGPAPQAAVIDAVEALINEGEAPTNPGLLARRGPIGAGRA